MKIGSIHIKGEDIMSMNWKLFSGFVVGFLFLPLIMMIDKYVGPGAGSIAVQMLLCGVAVALCVWLIDSLRKF